MMKIVALMSFLPSLALIGAGQDQTQVAPVVVERECNPTRWTLQARGAAFIPLKQQLRSIFGSGEPTMQLESSYAIFKDKWTKCDQLLLWENVSWTSKSGELPAWGYHTKLNLIPISVGLSYQVNIVRNVDFYFGLGPTYSFLRMKIKYPFDNVHIKRSQFGFMTKTGFRFTFATNYFFDIFGDYYFTEFSKINHYVPRINKVFNGFFVGGGFGGKW